MCGLPAAASGRERQRGNARRANAWNRAPLNHSTTEPSNLAGRGRTRVVRRGFPQQNVGINFTAFFQYVGPKAVHKGLKPTYMKGILRIQ